jgi:hypothetical protein
MMREYLGLCRPHGQLGVYVIPDRLVLPLVLIYLVIVRDTASPIVADRVGEVFPTIMMMVVVGRGVLQNLVRQDVQLSRLLVIFRSKVRGVMLLLAIIEIEGRVEQMRVIFMLAPPFLVVVVIRSI